tara:strand:+ start:52 stop:267 length:216 start_codon:yes stop_codon:yes gene_type:complete
MAKKKNSIIAFTAGSKLDKGVIGKEKKFSKRYFKGMSKKRQEKFIRRYGIDDVKSDLPIDITWDDFFKRFS